MAKKQQMSADFGAVFLYAIAWEMLMLYYTQIIDMPTFAVADWFVANRIWHQ